PNPKHQTPNPKTHGIYLNWLIIFCGKKKPTIDLKTKVASDDPSQLLIHFTGNIFKIDKNLGLVPTKKPKKNPKPPEIANRKHLSELRDLENELEEQTRRLAQIKEQHRAKKKIYLLDQFKYEKVKGKLIDVLREYEETVNAHS
ncbi:MAG: hypothetical protein AAF160_20830, partial [Pseudomonadota bacterium]